ncbi:hypothetical protein NC651_004741 [Populus alba x Populus x berolinensis]|nr:hypothetical protein NC651_004741 [Populus alba x Populus x berolinensis]
MPPQHGVANRRPQPPLWQCYRGPHPPAGYGRQLKLFLITERWISYSAIKIGSVAKKDCADVARVSVSLVEMMDILFFPELSQMILEVVLFKFHKRRTLAVREC